VPEADQQIARQAGQLPEQHQQQQVVGQHHAQHGAHEEQQEGEEARCRILGRQVPGGIEHHQRADAGDEQRQQPGQAVEPKAQCHAQLRQPLHAPVQQLAGEQRRRQRQQQAERRQRHPASTPPG
jgi:hypothetical protein